MIKATKFLILTLVTGVAILASACPQRTSISEIERNPSRYANKEVVITGTVRDSYGVSVPGTPIRGGIYKVDDGTGSIWILTEKTVPGKGSEIGVRGMVGNGITWSGRNYGLGLYEKERRFPKR